MRTRRHLVKNKLGHFYVRLYVPKELRPLIRKNELRKSMQTTCEATAITRSAFWIAAMKEHFQILREQIGMNTRNDTWALASRMMTVDGYRSFEAPDNSRRTEIGSLKIDGSPEDLAALELLLGREGANQVLAKLRIMPNANIREVVPPALEAGHGSQKQLSHSPHLAEYVQLYISRRKGSGSKANDTTLENYAKTVKLFTRMFGNLPVDQYSEQAAINFREKLRMCPVNLNKVLPWKNMSMELILEAEDVGKTLAPKTIKDYLTRMKSLFRDLDERKMVHFNIFKDVNVFVKARDRRKYMPFTHTELCKIFSKDSMQVDRAMPSHYWASLLALFTGMRRSELFFLTPCDIQVEDNIEFFDINDEGDKSTKNDSSIRKIPIHSGLINLGFLTYVQRVQDLYGEEVGLFSEYSNQGRQAGNKFSDWFSNYRKLLHIDGAGKVFHSFRSNFVNELERHHCDPLHIQRLTAHAAHSITHDATTGYGGKFSLEDLKTTIEKIDFQNVLVDLPKWHFI